MAARRSEGAIQADAMAAASEEAAASGEAAASAVDLKSAARDQAAGTGVVEVAVVVDSEIEIAVGMVIAAATESVRAVSGGAGALLEWEAAVMGAVAEEAAMVVAGKARAAGVEADLVGTRLHSTTTCFSAARVTPLESASSLMFLSPHQSSSSHPDS
mmetsp:Transcript_13054/g.35127  ORF Transcript_13054/g.35127 Transcript_13054/m.35127 type:complete len:158 (-) Transcript_13054:315-788(-)